MPLHQIAEADRREHCRQALESLEHWLRRLIDQQLRQAYGADYLNAQRSDTSRVIRNDIARVLVDRWRNDPQRYPRPIDAAMLDDLVTVICNPELYREFFAVPLQDAFESNAIARIYLGRLIPPRNALSHANPISVHDAYRVLCYSQDVIAALKAHYRRTGLNQQFNVPTIIRVADSLGHVTHIDGDRMHGFQLDYSQDTASQLRCGDTLSIEVEVDPSFNADAYQIEWSIANIGGPRQTGPRFSLVLTERYVGARLTIVCWVTSEANWHKLGNFDDQMDIAYRVLPPA
jgi:hypothetical protein